MFFEKWLNLDNDRKAIYFLGLSEKSFLKLVTSTHADFIRESLTTGGTWIKHRTPHPSDFYHYLEDEEDKDSLVMLMQDDEDNDILLSSWICVATSVAFTLYIASEYHHEILPQTADCSEYNKVFDCFYNNFSNLFGEQLAGNIEGKMLSLLEDGDARVFDKKYVITSLGIMQ